MAPLIRRGLFTCSAKTLRWLVAGAIGLGIVAGFGWKHRREAAALAALTPASPATAEAPRELRDRVAAADARARRGQRDALGELSRLYHANGYFAEARACYAALEQLQPDEPRWWHRHAVILSGFGDLVAARDRAERVVALAPAYRPAKLRLAEMHLKANDPAKAAALYSALLREKEDPHALLGLARIQVEAGRWSDAREGLERAVALTNFQVGYDLIVTVYEQLGLAQEAARIRGRTKASGAYADPPDPWIDELIADCFDAYRLSLAAGLAQRSGDPSAAQALLERALALAPGDVPIRFQYAQLLVERRDLRGARAQFEHCTRSDPTFADPWSHLAALAEQSGDAPAAERILTTGLSHCPDSAGLHLMRARMHRQAGRGPAAVAAYRRSLQLRPNEAEAYVELATLLLRSPTPGDAVALLERALQAEPDHPMALSLLALGAISSGDEPAARRWLGRMLKQPRISADQAAPVQAAYRGQFGREFRP